MDLTHWIPRKWYFDKHFLFNSWVNSFVFKVLIYKTLNMNFVVIDTEQIGHINQKLRQHVVK